MTSRNYHRLLQPVGRFWFAGKTYDRKQRRWIEAAIRSAVKKSMRSHKGWRTSHGYTYHKGGCRGEHHWASG